jgi:hypothetical protein
MNDVTSEQDRIESELRQTRSRMDDRLTELRGRMTPGQILDDLTGYLRGSQGADFANNLMATLRNNPVPAVLTGVGLIWLMASGPRAPAPLARDGDADDRPVPYPRYAAEPGSAAAGEEGEESLGQRLRRAEQGVVRWASESEESFNARLNAARSAVLGLARDAEETTEAFGARLGEAVAAAKRRIVETAHDLRDEAAIAGDRAGGTVRRVGDTLAQGSEAARGAVGGALAGIADNPVLLGALGFAGGAILGTLVPLSEAEEKALGGVGRQARETASRLAQEAVDTGGEAVKQALEAGLDKAKAHGLSADSTVKEVVETVTSGEILETAEDVATGALQAGADVISRSPPRPAPGATPKPSGGAGGMP